MKTLDDIRVYEGILADMEDTLVEGDIGVDPFTRFDVKTINIKSRLLRYLNHIDKDKLLQQTEILDLNKWDHLISGNDFGFMFVDDASKELILRLTWWICYELLYGQKPFSKTRPGYWLDMTNILKENDLVSECTLSRIYIYKNMPSGDWLHYISVILPTGDDLEILYSNKNILDIK